MTIPSYLAGFGHSAILYDIDPDKKDRKYLPGLGLPTFFINLTLTIKSRNICFDFNGIAYLGFILQNFFNIYKK
jgi:hypothetical protein